MRAAVFDGDKLEVVERPDPEPGPGEVRVALTMVGLCGSDAHFVIHKDTKPPRVPLILGHEPAGVVDMLGPGVDTIEVGTRVSVRPIITCGECDRCQAGRSNLCRKRNAIGIDSDGCWSDYGIFPAVNMIPTPENLSDEMAAVATDAVATAYHGVKTRARVGVGDRVAIFGVGGLGMSAVGIAKALGAAHVTAVDPREQARQWALDTGADAALHPDEAMAEIGGRVDAAVEFVGHADSVEAAVRSLDDGGRAVVVGVGPGSPAVRLESFVLRERSLLASYGSEPGEMREVVGLLASGKLVLPHVISDLIRLEDVVDGLQRLADGKAKGSRIVIDMSL